MELRLAGARWIEDGNFLNRASDDSVNLKTPIDGITISTGHPTMSFVMRAGLTALAVPCLLMGSLSVAQINQPGVQPEREPDQSKYAGSAGSNSSRPSRSTNTKSNHQPQTAPPVTYTSVPSFTTANSAEPRGPIATLETANGDPRCSSWINPR